MAYVPQQLPDEEKNQFGRTAPTTPNPTPAGGGSAGAGAAPAPGQGTSTQFGSNAAKLSDYLKANESQVAGFGNQVAGNLTQGYNKAMGSVDTGFGNFNQQVNQGYTPQNQDLSNRAAQNPSDFVKNQDDVKGFQSLYNDQYTGPQNFESSDYYANANKDVNKAVQDASLVGTQSGLGSYLNNYMNTGQNTQGMQSLDTALLQRSPEARTAIQNAAAPYQNLTGYLGGKATEADTNVANAKTQADQIRGAVQNQFTGQNGILPSLQNTINSGVQNAATQAQQQNDMLANPDYSKYMNFLNSAYGENYQANPNAMPTKENFSTPDQYSTAQALAQLTGTNPFLTGDTQNQAGTFKLTNPTSLENLQGEQKSSDKNYLANSLGISGNDPQFDAKAKAMVANTKDGTGASPVDILNGFVPNGAQPASPEAVDRAKALFRMGYADVSKLNDPNSIWQSARLGTGSPSTPTPTPPDQALKPPTGAYDPSNKSTWTQDQHPTGWNYYPGMGWGQNQNYSAKK